MHHNAVCADLLELAAEVPAGRQQLAVPSVASRLSAVFNRTSTPDSPGYSQAQVSAVAVNKVVEVVEIHCLLGAYLCSCVPILQSCNVAILA